MTEESTNINEKHHASILVAKAQAIAIIVGSVTAAMLSIYSNLRTEQKAKMAYEKISERIPVLEHEINELKIVVNTQQILMEQLEVNLDNINNENNPSPHVDPAKSLDVKKPARATARSVAATRPKALTPSPVMPLPPFDQLR